MYAGLAIFVRLVEVRPMLGFGREDGSKGSSSQVASGTMPLHRSEVLDSPLRLNQNSADLKSTYFRKETR